MNFDVFDMAPEDELNRILWAVTRPNDPYPAPSIGPSLPRRCRSKPTRSKSLIDEESELLHCFFRLVRKGEISRVAYGFRVRGTGSP